MPLSIPPGPYKIAAAPIPGAQFVLLTNNGEGKQLTVEGETGKADQEWYLTPTEPEGAYTITPGPLYPEFVSEDVPSNPNQVFLLSKPQKWVFSLLPDTKDIYYVIPDDHIAGALHLLGVEVNGGVKILDIACNDEELNVFHPGHNQKLPILPRIRVRQH
ncbi:hypothetical protein BYT27DRAFT_7255163 [Phlegmacium glaucopus]|nr:hypothetical protein BYT27DRAFT_7255163 [Phlegmacium glaucopus]